MISRIPPFIRGLDYIDYPGNVGNWRFVVDGSPVAVHLDVPVRHRVSFRDGGGTEWARLLPGADGHSALIIFTGYAWDGCSPKRRIGRCYFGTPDFEGTRLASCVHDVGYQFAGCEHWPFSKKQVDAMFYDIMRLSNFPLAGVYHGAVDKFSRRAWLDVDPGCHSVVLSNQLEAV